MDVPLLGRSDWWTLWFRALGREPPISRHALGTQLAAEYLDVAEAVAGHGIAIGSPILFRNELASGRLMPAHELVVSDGRSFWFVYPVARQNTRKIIRFGEWLCDEAASGRNEAHTFIRTTVVMQP